MTLTMSLSVAKMIDEALEMNPEADIDEITEAVMSRLTPEEYEFALRQLLPSRISLELGYNRRRANHNLATQKPTNSAKREAIRAAFFAQKMLTETGYKSIGDMTTADVRWAAEFRYRRAAQLTEKADQLTLLAKQMDALGVNVVRDMNYEDIHSVFEE
jgi:hypothetical protein